MRVCVCVCHNRRKLERGGNCSIKNGGKLLPRLLLLVSQWAFDATFSPNRCYSHPSKSSGLTAAVYRRELSPVRHLWPRELKVPAIVLPTLTGSEI